MLRRRVCLNKVLYTTTIVCSIWLVVMLKWAFIPYRTDQIKPSIEFPQQKRLYSSAHSEDENEISPLTEGLNEKKNKQQTPLTKFAEYSQ